jgi:hypothetical protein
MKNIYLTKLQTRRCQLRFGFNPLREKSFQMLPPALLIAGAFYEN